MNGRDQHFRTVCWGSTPFLSFINFLLHEPPLFLLGYQIGDHNFQLLELLLLFICYF